MTFHVWNGIESTEPDLILVTTILTRIHEAACAADRLFNYLLVLILAVAKFETTKSPIS